MNAASTIAVTAAVALLGLGAACGSVVVETEGEDAAASDAQDGAGGSSGQGASAGSATGVKECPQPVITCDRLAGPVDPSYCALPEADHCRTCEWPSCNCYGGFGETWVCTAGP